MPEGWGLKIGVFFGIYVLVTLPMVSHVTAGNTYPQTFMQTYAKMYD